MAVLLHAWDDPGAFGARCTSFLAPHEAENNLLFGLTHAIRRRRYDRWQAWTLERDDQVVSVALQTPPKNLVVSLGDEATMIALADALYEAHPDLPGVNGPEPAARAFVDRWIERSGGAFERTFAQRIYALRAVHHPSGVPGAARPASRQDLDLAMRWMFGFEGEAVGEVADEAERRSWAEARIADSELTLWEVDGVPVSMAGSSGPTPNGIRVGPVYTPRAERRRGYGSAVTAAESARRLAEGYRFCFLYTDLANPTSNSIYQRIGYEPVCDAGMYRFTA